MLRSPDSIDDGVDAAIREVLTQGGHAGALAGIIAASILSKLCLDALDEHKAGRAEDELLAIGHKAASLQRDLLMLRRHEASANQRMAALETGAGPAAPVDPGRLRALLFAVEVPMRVAQTCHVLLTLSERALDLIGMKSIPEVATACELACAGVMAGVVKARTRLAGIPEGSATGAAAARARADKVLTLAELSRTIILDRALQHLP